MPPNMIEAVDEAPANLPAEVLLRCQDIWTLRANGDLVCVLRTRREPVGIERRGPRNDAGVAGYGHDLIAWLIAAGIKPDCGCYIRLTDLMPPKMQPLPRTMGG